MAERFDSDADRLQLTADGEKHHDREQVEHDDDEHHEHVERLLKHVKSDEMLVVRLRRGDHVQIEHVHAVHAVRAVRLSGLDDDVPEHVRRDQPETDDDHVSGCYRPRQPVRALSPALEHAPVVAVSVHREEVGARHVDTPPKDAGPSKNDYRLVYAERQVGDGAQVKRERHIVVAQPVQANRREGADRTRRQQQADEHDHVIGVLAENADGLRVQYMVQAHQLGQPPVEYVLVRQRGRVHSGVC